MTARLRLILALALLACLAVSRAAALGAQARVDQTGQVVFVGTVLDSNGAPPPQAAVLQLVIPPPPGSNLSPRYCASGSSDAGGQFTLIPLPIAPGCTSPGNTLVLVVNGFAAQPTITVPSGPGTYTVALSLSVPLGGQPLTAPQTTPLPTGCSQVVVALGPGATAAEIATYIAMPSALLAVWHFDNGLKRFTAFFPDPAAPSDLVSLAPVDAVFVCVATATSITAP